MSVIPAPFLFRFTLPAARVDRVPRAKPPALFLPDECRVPWPATVGGEKHFAALRLGWNPQGVVVDVTVSGKPRQPFCNPDSIPASDAVLIWIDTRDTQTQHRGSRFCHHFVAMPWGGGDDGQTPVVRQLPVPRAREDAPPVEPESLVGESEIHKTGYRLAVWLPAAALHGFDPSTQRRLGFYLVVQDTELGKAHLSVGDDFPYEGDPSVWLSVELKDAGAKRRG
jgi:hypothetical protein